MEHEFTKKIYEISRYMACIEEIINVPILIERLEEAIAQEHLGDILNEIIKQSKVEFNYEGDYDMSDYEDLAISE
jgi:hypothetical protein